MKIAKMFKWYWQNAYWGLVGFYSVMAFLLIFGFCVALFSGSDEIVMNNFSPSTEITLFVIGILLFPTGVRFGLSSGVSRKTLFVALLLFLTALSAGMMLISSIGEQLGEWMGIETHQLQQLLYPAVTGFGGWLSICFCRISLGLSLGAMGYFIGGAYYRMNKVLKIVVSITVPALLFLGMPLFFIAFPSIAQGVFESLISPLFNWLLLSPYCLSLLCLGFAALFGVLSWLFVRRAPVKIAG